MSESDFDYARKMILSGRVPFSIRRYRPKRVFWVFFWIFVVVLAVLNLAGALPLVFWSKIIYFLPPFLLFVALRATLVRSAAADIGYLAAEIMFFGFIIAYGMLEVSSPLVAFLPENLVKAAAIFR